MRTLWLVTAFIAGSAASLLAKETRFPYEATVQSEEYARSGPGTRYYPTSRLKPGDRVTVHRHDPGGWYMIAPPPGSFSWIPERYVDRTGPKTGVVNANNVVVRVGSYQSDIRDVEQRRLSKGDEVQLLGQKTLESEKGAERWYQIAPPRGEYRWIPGQALAQGNLAATTPAASPSNPAAPGSKPAKDGGANSKRPVEADPFAEFANSTAPSPSGNSRPRVTLEDEEALIARSGPTAEELAQQRASLRQLDERLSEILAQDASRWNFGELEQAYRQLRSQASGPAIQRQVDLRLATLDEYKQLKRDYEEFVNLTAQTTQREMQLLSIQRNQGGQTTHRPVTSTGTGRLAPEPDSRVSPPSQPESPPKPQTYRFDGAGIIQRATPRFAGAPRYALVAPGGRLLALLKAQPDTQLEPYVGRSMGINGPRSFDRSLGIDVIEVREVTPVKLVP